MVSFSALSLLQDNLGLKNLVSSFSLISSAIIFFCPALSSRDAAGACCSPGPSVLGWADFSFFFPFFFFFYPGFEGTVFSDLLFFVSFGSRALVVSLTHSLSSLSGLLGIFFLFPTIRYTGQTLSLYFAHF